MKQKAKIDVVAHKKLAYERPNPTCRTYGPRTRREFLNLVRWGSN
jgi:hypothetical protein